MNIFIKTSILEQERNFQLINSSNEVEVLYILNYTGLVEYIKKKNKQVVAGLDVSVEPPVHWAFHIENDKLRRYEILHGEISSSYVEINYSRNTNITTYSEKRTDDSLCQVEIDSDSYFTEDECAILKDGRNFSLLNKNHGLEFLNILVHLNKAGILNDDLTRELNKIINPTKIAEIIKPLFDTGLLNSSNFGDILRNHKNRSDYVQHQPFIEALLNLNKNGLLTQENFNRLRDSESLVGMVQQLNTYEILNNDYFEKVMDHQYQRQLIGIFVMVGPDFLKDNFQQIIDRDDLVPINELLYYYMTHKLEDLVPKQNDIYIKIIQSDTVKSIIKIMQDPRFKAIDVKAFYWKAITDNFDKIDEASSTIVTGLKEALEKGILTERLFLETLNNPSSIKASGSVELPANSAQGTQLDDELSILKKANILTNDNLVKLKKHPKSKDILNILDTFSLTNLTKQELFNILVDGKSDPSEIKEALAIVKDRNFLEIIQKHPDPISAAKQAGENSPLEWLKSRYRANGGGKLAIGKIFGAQSYKDALEIIRDRSNANPNGASSRTLIEIGEQTSIPDHVEYAKRVYIKQGGGLMARLSIFKTGINYKDVIQTLENRKGNGGASHRTLEELNRMIKDSEDTQPLSGPYVGS